jgi:hypothetical protein
MCCRLGFRRFIERRMLRIQEPDEAFKGVFDLVERKRPGSNAIAKPSRLWDIPIVTTAKVDDRKRVLIPQAKPGQVLAVQQNPDGSITLTPIKGDVKERPYDRHLYDDYPEEAADLEAAFARMPQKPDRE